jgi:hypothetical protein
MKTSHIKSFRFIYRGFLLIVRYILEGLYSAEGNVSDLKPFAASENLGSDTFPLNSMAYSN